MMLLKGKPTELCDGNYHRNKNNSILVEWHDIPKSKVPVYGVPIERSFYHRKWTFRLKNKVNDQKPSKYIENKYSHRTFPPILIGNLPIAREILSMFELGRKPSQVILGVFFYQK